MTETEVMRSVSVSISKTER
jgi:hypothetical protein